MDTEIHTIDHQHKKIPVFISFILAGIFVVFVALLVVFTKLYRLPAVTSTRVVDNQETQIAAPAGTPTPTMFQMPVQQ